VETQSYKIKTSGFEGPFALLLELVEKRKLFINDVSLAAVTEGRVSGGRYRGLFEIHE